MALTQLLKRLKNIMRKDDISGATDYLRQMIWLVFLKVYDAKEEVWELKDPNYESVIPDGMHWHEWAIDNKDGKALTADELLVFVNDLIMTLKNIEINEFTPKKHIIVRNIFEDASNKMKDGVKLREMINALNEADFTDSHDNHLFGDIYEEMLKDLQDSKGDGGEFFTPRAVTDYVTSKVDPQLGESVADFAAGTGGFLISALQHLSKNITTPEDIKIVRSSLYGIEKKSFPYALGLTNMILHEVDEPQFYLSDSLSRDVRDYKENEKFDCILMNPPYGAKMDDIARTNFPLALQSGETADLFVALIMYRLKLNGKAGIVLPDGFLFGDGAKNNIKDKLLNEFNLHTIVRLPAGVFSPYTSITTNLLFFDNNGIGTKETWFYRLDLPDGWNSFSKTKPIKAHHFDELDNWWSNRVEIKDTKEDENMTDTWKAKKYSFDELVNDNYNLDKCGYPTKEEIIYPPKEALTMYLERRNKLNKQIDEQISEILSILGEI